MAWPVLVFDIESIPDIDGLRALRGASTDQTDEQVYGGWLEERKAKGQSDFMPLHLQRVLVISCVFRNAEGIRIHSFVDRDGASEGKVIQNFFNSVDKHVPQLVSWNGGGFDLPVLHYRGLMHRVTAPRYWDMGEGDYRDSKDFKWNNYISRYHSRHTDLMDLLAMYQPRGSAPLDQLARLMGLPGKLGMDGSAVWGAWLEGRADEIRDYCETDVVNTWLVFLRFQMMRGLLTAAEHDAELALVKSSLTATGLPHWKEFLALMPQ